MNRKPVIIRESGPIKSGRSHIFVTMHTGSEGGEDAEKRAQKKGAVKKQPNQQHPYE